MSPRADAELNRERILDAARAALEDSSEPSMNAIAQRAGVGAGTLYRHFPTREALVLSVYRTDVRDLVGAATLLLDAYPPLQALRLWLDRLASFGRVKKGLASALRTISHAQVADENRDAVLAAIEQLLQACRGQHLVRADISADELLLLVGFLWHLDQDWQTRSARMLDLVVDGLTQGAPGITEGE